MEKTIVNKNDIPVLILDPCCFSPFYNYNLTNSLAKTGWPANLMTSEFPFESVATGEPNHQNFFYNSFPAVSLISHRAVKRNNLLRGILKTILYASEMRRFTHYLSTFRSTGIIHVQWANIPWLDKKLWTRWKQMGWKLVYTSHDPEPLKGTTSLSFLCPDPPLFKTADAIVVHSEAGRKSLVLRGVDPTIIHEIAMGPTLPVEMEPLPQDEARLRIGIPIDAPVLLFFGFIKPYKGLDQAIRALPEVLSVLPRTRLIVAGRMMESQVRYDELINQLDLGDSILWNPEFVPSSKIPYYFSAADIVIAPYLQASSSAVIDVAHYFGKTVIATAVGGLDQQIQVNHGDRLIAPGDHGILATAIIDALKTMHASAKVKNEAETKPKKDLDTIWAAIARNHQTIYSHLL